MASKPKVPPGAACLARTVCRRGVPFGSCPHATLVSGPPKDGQPGADDSGGVPGLRFSHALHSTAAGQKRLTAAKLL